MSSSIQELKIQLSNGNTNLPFVLYIFLASIWYYNLILLFQAINNGTFTTDTLTDSSNHTSNKATSKENLTANNDHKQGPPTFLTKKSTNTNWVNEDPYKKKLDYTLEFGKYSSC